MKLKRTASTLATAIALAGLLSATAPAAGAIGKSSEGLIGGYATKATCEYYRAFTTAKVGPCLQIGSKWWLRIHS